MKIFFSYVLFFLFAVWLIMAALKISMALNGVTDPINGRDSSDIFISGLQQFLLSLAAFWGAKKLRSSSAGSFESSSEYGKKDL